MKIAKLKLENLDFSYRVLLSIIFILGAILVIFIRLQSKPEKSFAAWFDDAYTYRQTIAITHNANVFANRAIGVSVSTSGLVSAVKMQSDCDDTRFTDSSGKVLPYQLVSGCNGTNTQYTVVVPTINNGTNYIYVYYGNPTATSNSQDVSGYTPLTPSTAGPAAATEETTPGPLAYWKMNEGVGTTTFDSSSRNIKANFATGTSAPTWKTEDQCLQGKCLSFDGNDYLTAADSFNPTAYTLEAWVKPVTTTSVSIIVRTAGSPTGSWSHQLRITSGGKFESYTYDGAGKSVIGTTTVVAGTWYHVVATATNGGSSQLFVNGRQEGTPTTITTLWTGGSSYMIGSNSGDSMGYYNGIIDDVKIYPYARSTAQVLADYNSRGTVHGSSVNLGNLSIADTGPIAYWNFEEGVGTSVYDTGTSANNGTFGTGNSAPSWSTGKFGKALSFDGVNDKVVTTQPTRATTNVTLQAWINPAVVSQNDGMVIHNGTDSGGYAISYGGADSSNSKFYILFSGIIWFDTGYTFPAANTWYHVAITRDGTTWRAYVNGVQTPNTTTQSPATPTDTYFEIGHQPQKTARHFQGLIDEVKVYNYPRTQKQIIADMNGGHPAGGSPVGSQLGYWKFDEGVGGTAFNTGSVGSTINANLQTGTSAPTWNASGVYNKALSFDGNDYLTVPETGDLRFPTTAENFTLSAWVKRSGVGTTQYILSKEDSDNDGWRLLFDAGNTITCSIGATDVTSTLTVTDTTTWHHIACAMDRAGTGQVYLDGKPASPTTSIAGQALNTTTALTIGSRSYTPTFFFNGLIDEVKIYSSQLTASEILIDYNRGQAIQQGSLSTGTGNTNPNTSGSQEYCVPGDTAVCTPPTSQWKFEEGVGTTAYDNGGGGYHGVFGSGSAAPTWSSGMFGKGLSFDGSNDYLTVSYLAANNLSAGNISMWIKFPNVTASQSFFSKQHNGIDSQLIFQTNASSLFQFQVKNTAGFTTGTTTVVAGTWYFVAANWNGSTQNIYVNGKLEGTTSTAQTLPSDTSSISIGAWTGDGNNFGEEIIDEVRIYNYARTPAQVAWEYNQGEPSLWYKMDECQGTTLFDSIGTGNTGTITIGGSYINASIGACAVVNSSAMWYQSRNGKTNSSVFTDGFDDYVNFGTPAVLNVGATNESYSFAFWVDSQTASAHILSSAPAAVCTSSAYPFLFSTDASQFIQFSIRDSSANCPIITASSLLTGWHHIAGVRDVTNDKLYLYIDGKLNGSTNDTTTASATNAYGKYIGANATGSSLWWYGFLDDLRFYRYALTPTQVQLLYNNGSVNFAPVTGAP